MISFNNWLMMNGLEDEADKQYDYARQCLFELYAEEVKKDG